MDIVGTRRGEKYFARASVMHGQILCDHNMWCANWRRRLGGARAGEKYFAPTLVVLLIGMGGGCMTAHQSRT